jgi:hypothetical protein
MKRVCFFLAVFVFLSSGLFSRESMEDGNRVSAVSVAGLKRTRPHVIEKPLRKFIGRDAGSVDTNEVFAIVKGTGILEPLSVEILDNQEGSGKTLAITVKEKWSVFPVPFGGVNSSGWSAGGVLMDANAFGLRDQLMVMGIFGAGDLTASLMYFDSPDGPGEFGWNAMGWFSLQENKTTDQAGEKTLRRYNSMSIKPVLGLLYSPGEHSTAGVSVAYRYVAPRDTEDPVNAPEEGTRGITLSPNIGVRYNSWDGYFLNENSASLKYEYTFVIDGDDIHSVSLNAAFSCSIIPGFRLMAKSGAVFAAPSASPFFETAPMNGLANIFSARYSAVNIAGVSLGLEKYLFKFKAGTVSMSAEYQAVYSHSGLLPHQFDHGASAMLRLYFAGLALPGMGLGGAYNADKNVWHFAFSFGMTF